MALSLGVHKSAEWSTDYNVVTTAGITTTTGSCLIVGMMYEASSTPPVLSDSKSNIWVKVGTEYTCHSFPGYAVFYKNEGGTRGASHTFTATKTNGYSSLWVQEILGNSPVVDTVTTGILDSSSPYQSNAYTNGVANEYLLCLCSPQNDQTTVTVTWGGSFASTGDDIIDTTKWVGSLAYRLISSIASYTASATTNGTTTAIGFQVLGVKETDSGATTIQGTLMEWNGSSWIRPTLKEYAGSFGDKAVKYWDGSKWVIAVSK